MSLFCQRQLHYKRFPFIFQAEVLTRRLRTAVWNCGSGEGKTGKTDKISLFFPADSPLVTALYKAYVDVTGDTENKPMVIGGGTYAKSLKNIIAFGPEMPGIDYRIHSADEYILVSGMEESVLIYMEAIKNLLAI